MKRLLQHTTEVRARAALGDEKAKRELVALCRRGMLVPDWEEGRVRV